ncbi:uncharacterized protein LOC131938082 [Physella acuta]|uniref:uncharacterized protein LOC131938082 n=1 Tax=Physella acuta TaxID=109671 RepID=UPI0027DE1554|nr:uncharacterized protein LOC131938082 [Physella acuta]
MYTLTKAPSKIVTSARRGPLRQVDFDSHDTREKSTFIRSLSKPDIDEQVVTEMNIQKPVFQQRRTGNNKRSQPVTVQDPNLHENHVDMVNLLMRQWKKVQESHVRGRDGESGYEMYLDKEPKREMDSNFQPFDLEKYWGTKTLTSALGKPTS